MRRAVLSLALVFCVIGVCNAQGQRTSSNRPFEISTGQGAWGAWLPKYVWGCILDDEYDEIPRSSHHIPKRYLRDERRSDEPGIFDKMNLAGYQGDLRIVRRPSWTSTNFEGRVHYATAESTATGSEEIVLPVLVPRAHNQNEGIFSGTWRLKSEVQNYGFDYLLRDTWNTRFGGLSAGFGYSYLAFDQTFKSTLDNDPPFREELDTDFQGGKAFVGWDGQFRGNSTNLDLVFGFYNMNAKYEANFVEREMTKNVPTLEANFATRRDFLDKQIGTTIGIPYLPEMPMIQHNFDAPVSIGTDDSLMLKVLLEIVL